MNPDGKSYADMTREEKIAYHREDARYHRYIGELGFARRADRMADDLEIYQ